MFINNYGRALRATGSTVLIVLGLLLLGACKLGSSSGGHGGGGGGGGGGGITDAPNPTHDAANVVSLWSNGNYTDVAVDTWQTPWSNNATMSDHLFVLKTSKQLTFPGDTGTGAYLGVELTTTPQSITGKTHLHFHYYTTDGTAFKVKVVDFGADGAFGGGDDVDSGEISVPSITQGAWAEADIDVSGLPTTGHIAQILFVANGVGTSQTFYLDNIYFYGTPCDASGGGAGTDAKNPCPAPSDVISMWSNGNYTDVGVDTWTTPWSNNASITEHVIVSKTSKQLNFPGDTGSGAYLGVEMITNGMQNITGKTHFHFHYFTADGTAFKVKVVDFGADGAFGGGDDVDSGEISVPSVTQGVWTEADIDVSGLPTTGHIAQILFVANGVGTSQTYYLDNIYFH